MLINVVLDVMVSIFTPFMCREEVIPGAHQGVIESLYGLSKFMHDKKCSLLLWNCNFYCEILVCICFRILIRDWR